MAGVNKAIIMGYVGKEPLIKPLDNGNMIASFSIATSESYTDKTGQKKETTEWHNITAFGKQAELVQKYVKKGDPLYIEGKIKTEKYTDKAGVERYSTKIMMNTMQFVPRKKEGSNEQLGLFPEPSSMPQSSGQSAQFTDDDIPF